MRVPVDLFTPILAYSAPPIVTMCGTRRQRLDVVDDRRLRVEAVDRRERRLEARHAALALERLEQAGLLAADVRARAAVHDDLEIEARTEDVLAEEALRARVGERLREAVVAERELAAQVDERLVALDRVRRDDDALDELVRIALDEHAVLERRRLAFVGVHHEVAREQASGRNDHFCPVEKFAPPRPRSPDSFTCSWTSAGSPLASTARSAS